MSGKQPVGFEPITVPTVSETTVGSDVVLVGHLRTISGPVGIEGRHAHLLLTRNQTDVLVRALAAQLGLVIVEADHDFVAADGDPGHCVICGEYDSDHEGYGYDPERDDFDDEVDTPDDYEGDKYNNHEFEPRPDMPEICRNCQEERDWHYHTEDEDTIECGHCGRTVPYAETSEGMCSICPDEPITRQEATS